MRIAYKLHVTNLSAIVLIALIGFFSYRNYNEVLTKLRYIEIADDLNASFLEMRLNEKNFFLYKDPSAMTSLRSRLSLSITTMDSVKDDIIRATGRKNYDTLKARCVDYKNKLESIDDTVPPTPDHMTGIRESGQKLREFSSHITDLERKKTNEIIMKSKRGLTTTLFTILFSAISVSYLFFFNILKSLNRIKQVARAISNGQYYTEIGADIPRDEVGSVLKAINLMARELENREEQIIQSRKLASIGILTAGVAHELGNPLNNISMVAQTYLEFYPTLSDADRIGFMKMVEDESDRIKDVVTNLLDFSKPKKLNPKPSNPNAIVNKSIKLVQNMIHISNIDVHLDLFQDIPDIFVDENRILEVLVNLITNAIHAMEPGGKLALSTALHSDKILIRIKDNGKGIPHDILPHLFDPFFSTKGTEGTGLGLFVSYGIISNHGGTLSVESVVDEGTMFTIELPLPENN